MSLVIFAAQMAGHYKKSSGVVSVGNKTLNLAGDIMVAELVS